jgi:hypothetical protein
MTLIELSHTIEDGMITYKGLPAPVICDHMSRLQSRHRQNHAGIEHRDLYRQPVPSLRKWRRYR